MTEPLLATKFHVPRPRREIVGRTRLIERLDSGAPRLTLVAAPPGFGKTTAVAQWLATGDESDRPVAWLSLDTRDNAVDVFWRYVVTTIDRARPGTGAAALQILQSSSASIESALDTLLNDLQSSPPIVLVLDDFHVIDDPVVHAGMTYLVENLPPPLRLVIVSRTDPPLPLARLRAHGQLIEVRAHDLRFTESEAALYLNDVMALSVSPDDIVTLDDRTEGWIAALQLAAISMQGRADSASFIAGFAGDDRYVVDYLVEEVLQRQPERVRTFLLQTSILSRFTGDLCDAVTGERGRRATLETLDRANLFLVPLDDQRQWYRYHHLFAEMLRARLTAEMPDLIPDLNLRASEWHDRHGHTEEAIGHAFDAGAFERAADLVEAASTTLRQHRHEVALLRWLELLPAAVVDARPSLCLVFAGTLLSTGRIDHVEHLLRIAESALDGGSDEIRALHAGIALYRAAQSLVLGETASAAVEAHRAVELAAHGSEIERGASAGLLGLVLWTRGDLDEARESWADALAHLAQGGYLSDTLGGSLAMADIQLAQGRLSAAADTYRRGLDLARESHPPLRGAADMHVGVSSLLRERNDLVGAREQLEAAEAFGEYGGLPQNRHRRRIAEARVLQAEGDPVRAIALLDEAERCYAADMFPDVRPIGAVRARIQLAAGRIHEAREWACRRGLSIDDDLSYLREFEHATLARVLLTDPSTRADAVRLSERLLNAALAAGDREGSVIELLVLRALALQSAERDSADRNSADRNGAGRDRAGRNGEALDALRDALARAQAEGYVRVFIDEGEPMNRLLAALATQSGPTPYLRTLLSASATAGGSDRDATTRSPALIEPLSERELDVLRLLRSDLGGPDIARHLFVSLNTMRTHTKSIYAKLGVNSRRAAVRRALELGILR